MELCSNVNLREYNERDLESLCRMYLRQGFDYEMPSLESPLLVTKIVAESGKGIKAAALLRLTAEAYLLTSEDMRAKDFLTLHEGVRREALSRGLDDVHCWIPPEIEQKFGRQLMCLGWQKQAWQSYSRRTEI